ncbi:tenascin isoform X4 [Pseudoliparis swirei]|uniref:tenascin isoform X4 n=1 Tax=Pseudoliparis swirei TaxID=2059687 RepID=UPI0024BE9ABB|nr:tenascin isoform X4 [Pseudoliparis swirei]
MGTRGVLGCLLLTALLSLSNAGLVKKILRHRRQTLEPPEELNITLPSAHRPVVFNHIYNINVPASSLCSVDLDAPESTQLGSTEATASSGEHFTEHTVDGENQIVFTHRINVPRQACGCAKDLMGLKDLTGLKELMSRIEMLEGEVSLLRDQCNGDRACCGTQVTGVVGTKPYCHGHGNYSAETCGCVCEPGWKGPNCTEPECPGNCQNRGRCVDGTCECFKDFAGADCTLEICPVDCGAHGQCVGGVCICSDGFLGDDCSRTECLNNCRGRCEDGDCVCDEPWTGSDCSELNCPKDCNDRGRCQNGTCYCHEGYAGKDCGERTCANNCHGNGFCVNGQCDCAAGFSGDDCSRVTCLNDCNGRGTCFNGMCICDVGYQGADCSQLACLNNCNRRGQCVNGQCACNVGFQGDDCAKLSCPNNCRQRGRCVNGQCVCEEGFAGEDCSIRTCPSNCYGRGKCIEGRCVCQEGFTSEDCGEVSCPRNCRNRGQCVDGQCVCNEGFSGEDCGQRACPNDCLTRGDCVDGKCVCGEGYSGHDCSVHACPGNCNNRGRCVGGRCTCASGYEGEGCAELSCLNNCRDNGRCLDGLCVCEEGYIGEDCSEVSPPMDLSVGEVTSDTVDLSWDNEMLVTEYLVTYVPTSPGGLQMEFTVAGDKAAATVKELEPGIEYLINVYAVLSNKKSIPVSARVATELPKPDGVIFKSLKETSVEVMWDQLDISFDGWEIYFRNTKEENGKVVTTLPPTQTHFLQSGLGPGQEYEVSINIIKNNTRGPQTSKKVTTKIKGPRQVEVKDVTDSSALVGWSQPAAPTDRLTMLYWSTSDPSEETRVEMSPQVKQHSIDGLRPDTEYTVSLVSRRGKLHSDPSNTTFTTAMDAPVDLQAVTQTDDSITLEWTNTQADVGEYLVKYSPLSGSTHGEELVPRGPGDTTKATITGLKPGMEYGIGVTAVKKERESNPATTNAATDIDPPRDLKETQSTENTLTLRWRKPRAKVAAYRLVYVSGDGQVGEAEIPPAATSYVVSNLMPGTSYTITLAAERGLKRSTPVTVSASTVEPKPMVHLTASDITWDGFTASWSPTSGEFDSFVIEVTNLENLKESQNLSLSGDAFSLGISGLNPNTSYMVGLFGMYRGSFLEPVYTQATTVNQPVVGKLYISNLTSESFSISWNGTEGEFDGFILEIIDSDWLMEPKEYNVSRSVASHDVTGLRPSTDYIAYLYGTFKGSRTSAISIVASTAEEPDLSRLVVSNVTSDRLYLSWRTGEKAFDVFIVEVRESALPSQAMGRTLAGDVRSAVMAGLKARTSYDIKLYASAGGQNTQPLFDVATTEDVPQLGPIAASSVSPHNLSLSWSAVSGHFDGFVVRVSDPEQQSDTLEFKLPGEVRNFTVSNLMDATGYDIELYGISHGRHTPSVLAHAVTAPLPKVENLTISNLTPYGFRVSWEVKQQQQQQQQQKEEEEEEEEELAPSSGGFTHFQIVVTDSGWLLEPQEFTLPGNQSHLDIWGLITGIGYEVRLTGVSESGLLSRPLTTVAVTEAEPEVEHLFVSDVTADGFRLSWAADDDLFDRYVIKIRDGKKFAHPREYSASGAERTKVLTGLMSGTEYEIELYGVTLDERSQPITGVAQTGLSTPRGLSFSEVTDSSAVVHWSMPRSPVDNYRIAYVPFEGGSPLVVTVGGDVFETVLPDMIPGKMYQVSVSGVKGLEESDPSTDTVITALDRPQGLTAANVTDASALLVWQPSVATVDGYVITYSADSVSHVVERVSGNTVEFEMNSLVPGAHYTVGVHSLKEAQKSDSAVTEFTTDVDPPRDLMAVNIQTDSATLTWKPPQAAVTGYTLTFSADGAIREVVLSPTASSYSMAALTGSTEYDVTLQAIAGTQRSRHVTTVFTTIGQLYRRPRDCAQIFLNGEASSGLYAAYVNGEERPPIQVYCDMTTDGGGWMVFLRRQNGKLEFFRNWRNYTGGFGNMKDEFWLGLSNLHKITNSGHYELRVDLRDGGESAYAQYDKLTIAEPKKRYKIYVGAYSGTAGDSMTYHQGRPFSTFDNDNDIAVTNCALSYKGAFWYKNCHRVNLMGKYGDGSHSKGINWFHWKGHEHSIEFAEMKIRPANFRHFESRKKRS